MRVIAILATYNEERFISACLENLARQGVEFYLLDNESTDKTISLAERFRERGLVGIETIPRLGMYSWRPILERKEQIAARLKADWFMHVDADEIHLPAHSTDTLAKGFTELEAQGFNAVNFMEFTFIPTRESPNHDYPDFQRTMLWYYPFLPNFPHRLNAWKKQPEPVELAWSGGHLVRFPGLRIAPQSFLMRHYLFLSVPHAVHKFVKRRYDPAEVESGWHGWHAKLKPEMIILPSEAELRKYTNDEELNSTHPRTVHYLEELVSATQLKKRTDSPK